MSGLSLRRARVALLVLPATLFLACSGSVAPAPSPEPSAQTVVHGELGADLDGLLTDLSRDGFSGAVLVANKGVVLLQKGYGLADRDSEVPVTADTLFEIGTMAKIFTAAAVLKLAADGRLSLEDRVSKHTGPLNGDNTEATIHQLLVHTSGLFGRTDRLSYDSREAFLESVREAGGRSQPGEEYRYSNAGYTLLAAIVETTSGMPFEDYLQEHLFRPAGMSSTGFVWDQVDSAGKRNGADALATGYEGQFRDDLAPVTRPDDVWGSRGPSGIATTVGDLHRWIQALESGAILPAESVETMFTAFEGQTGYAWQVVDDSSLGRLVRRGGVLPAFEASIRWYRDADLAIVLALNTNMGHRIKAAKGIAGILAPYVEPPR